MLPWDNETMRANRRRFLVTKERDALERMRLQASNFHWNMDHARLMRSGLPPADCYIQANELEQDRFNSKGAEVMVKGRRWARKAAAAVARSL